jgi:hypothetical protein
MRRIRSFVLLSILAAGLVPGAEACINLLVTKGASADGSTMITYACDSEFHYRDMSPEVRALQTEIEGEAMALQPVVEEAALRLLEKDPALARRYLTDHSVSRAERVVSRWRELAERPVTMYNEGYVQDETGEPKESGYPEEWLREVIRSDPERFLLRPERPGGAGWKLVD